MMKSIVPLAAAVLVLASCEKEPAWKKHDFTKQEVARAAKDVDLPLILWRRIEAVYSGAHVTGGEVSRDESGHGGGHGGDHGSEHGGEHGAPAEGAAHGEAAAAESEGGGGEHGGGGGGGEGSHSAGSHLSLPTEFAPLKVFLIEKNRGILRRQNTELAFGPGGGEIDLRDLVESKRGSFYLAFEFMPEADPKAEHKVFFLSNGIRRKRGDEKIGNGCDRYYDVTKAFDKAMKGEGFLLNTTDQRHVSALAGTFFFATKHADKLFLAQLTVKDSGQRALHCRH